MSIEVLLVDEDRDVLEVVAAFLGQEDGFEVTAETDPEAALETTRTEPFDAVVSDYKMPKLDGLELCAAIRERGDDVPFFLFTARERDEMVADATAAGATDVVQKGTGTDQYGVLADRIRESL